MAFLALVLRATETEIEFDGVNVDLVEDSEYKISILRYKSLRVACITNMDNSFDEFKSRSVYAIHHNYDCTSIGTFRLVSYCQHFIVSSKFYFRRWWAIKKLRSGYYDICMMVLVRQDTDIAKSNFRLPWPLEQSAEQLRPSNPRSTLTLTLNFYFIAPFILLINSSYANSWRGQGTWLPRHMIRLAWFGQRFQFLQCFLQTKSH